MSLITANDVAVLSGTITLPLVGVWIADLVIDQPDGTGFAPGTAVTIKSLAGYSLSGVVDPVRTGDFLDAVHVRILGGKGGLGKIAQPRGFVQPGAFVRDVINGLVSDAGETLSTTADQGILGTNLVAWSTVTMPASQAMQSLLGIVAPTANWRILADGTLWIGSETWPASTASFDLLGSNPAEQSFDLGVESPLVAPGTSLSGIGNVDRVEHQIYPDKIRTRVWVAVPGITRGLAPTLQGLAEQAVASMGIDYLALYDSKVVAQSADFTTLDVQPADPRLPGLQRVPLRHGVPGLTVQVSPGAIVRLGWDRGNPSMPFVALWNGGETVLQFNVTATAIDIKATGNVTVEATGTATVKGTASTVLGAVGTLPVLTQGPTVDGMGVPCSLTTPTLVLAG